MLVLGAGTDYALLLASRFREELRRTDDKYDAMRTAWRATIRPVAEDLLAVVEAAAGHRRCGQRRRGPEVGEPVGDGFGDRRVQGCAQVPAATVDLFSRRARTYTSTTFERDS